MKKYRRIEINAYRRRVTVVSGAWRPDELFEPTPADTDDEVALKDTGVDEPIEPDSPEGQMILAEAMLSLKRRLLPETQSAMASGEITADLNRAKHNVLSRQLQALSQFIWPESLRFARRLARKEK